MARIRPEAFSAGPRQPAALAKAPARIPGRELAIIRRADLSPIQGDLQTQIMSALWRLEAGTVEQVRNALPTRYRSAYTTVQTVLNRLSERELLTRKRQGRGFVYRPKISEAQYLLRTIQYTFASASPGAMTHLPHKADASLRHRAVRARRRSRQPSGVAAVSVIQA